jgi:hypothetical protein
MTHRSMKRQRRVSILFIFWFYNHWKQQVRLCTGTTPLKKSVEVYRNISCGSVTIITCMEAKDCRRSNVGPSSATLVLINQLPISDGTRARGVEAVPGDGDRLWALPRWPSISTLRIYSVSALVGLIFFLSFFNLFIFLFLLFYPTIFAISVSKENWKL